MPPGQRPPHLSPVPRASPDQVNPPERGDLLAQAMPRRGVRGPGQAETVPETEDPEMAERVRETNTMGTPDERRRIILASALMLLDLPAPIIRFTPRASPRTESAGRVLLNSRVFQQICHKRTYALGLLRIESRRL